MKEPDTSKDANEILDSLTYDDTTEVPELPPTADEVERTMTVVRSLKMTPEMDRRVKEMAAEHCVTQSMLIRQYIEMGLAAEQPDRLIPLSDAIRVLSSLRPSA